MKLRKLQNFVDDKLYVGDVFVCYMEHVKICPWFDRKESCMGLCAIYNRDPFQIGGLTGGDSLSLFDEEWRSTYIENEFLGYIRIKAQEPSLYFSREDCRVWLKSTKGWMSLTNYIKFCPTKTCQKIKSR